jgi:hypothetical protein
MKTLVSFLALFVSPCLSTAFSQSMSICKPDYMISSEANQNIWTQSIQDAIML